MDSESHVIHESCRLVSTPVERAGVAAGKVMMNSPGRQRNSLVFP